MSWNAVMLILFFGVILKIPIGFACWLVWHAVRAVPDPPEAEGGEEVRPLISPRHDPPPDLLDAELLLDHWPPGLRRRPASDQSKERSALLGE